MLVVHLEEVSHADRRKAQRAGAQIRWSPDGQHLAVFVNGAGARDGGANTGDGTLSGVAVYDVARGQRVQFITRSGAEGLVRAVLWPGAGALLIQTNNYPNRPDRPRADDTTAVHLQWVRDSAVKPLAGTLPFPCTLADVRGPDLAAGAAVTVARRDVWRHTLVLGWRHGVSHRNRPERPAVDPVPGRRAGEEIPHRDR